MKGQDPLDQPEIRAILRKQADLELGKRGIIGSVVYVMALIAFLIATPFEKDFPEVTLAYGILITLFSAARFGLTVNRQALYGHSPVFWTTAYAVIITACALLMGGFSALTFIWYGISTISLFSILIVIGICGGAIISLGTHLLIFRIYVFLMLVPATLICLALASEPAYALAFLLAQTYLFLNIQGKYQNRLYWDAIKDNMLLKIRQTEIESARRAAESASRAKSEFLASMSHEIRTPMNAILGMSEILQRSDLAPAQKEHVGIIQSAGKSLLNLINDILDLSKVEAGRLKLEEIPFDLRELVRKTVEMTGVNSRSKQIELRCTIDAGIPPLIFGDPHRLRQILTNLIANAVKFTERGSVSVTVEKVSETFEELVWRCHVRDTGIGIAPEKFKSIFESFTQADSSTTRKYGGTGLGLTIAKRLIDLMGGEIWVESTPGAGSVFSFALKSAALRAGEKSEDPAEEEILEAVKNHRPLKILVVDDHAENLEIIRGYLEGTPFAAETAKTGEEGIEKFKAGSFDLVLMDLQMPGIDGLEATRRIRQWEKENADAAAGAGQGRPAVPILALTAHAFREETEKIIAAGCQAHLAKPVDYLTLLDAICRHAPHAVNPPGPR